MADTKTFRHKLTGLVGVFPTVFGELFHEVLEEVEGEAASSVVVPASVAVVSEPASPDASDSSTEGSDK